MKKIFTVLGAGMLLLIVSAGFTSCEGDKNYYQIGADTQIHYYDVEQGMWRWNSSTNRLETVFTNQNIIDDYIFNDQGSIFAGVYITDDLGGGNTRLSLTSLPYLYTFDDGGVSYTENIGFEISLANGGQILFYIQDSELRQPRASFLQFKVTRLWQQ